MNEINQFLHENGPLISALLTLTTAVFGFLFKTSERLALDSTTQANGIKHGWQLGKSALAIAPVILSDVAEGKDVAAVIEDAAGAIEAEPAPAAIPQPAAAPLVQAQAQEVAGA